jgi:hypothetical protein
MVFWELTQKRLVKIKNIRIDFLKSLAAIFYGRMKSLYHIEALNVNFGGRGVEEED